MAISSPGIGSNLDVNGIVSQLMNIEKQPLASLATKEVAIQSKISAYGTIQGALASLQSAVQGLADASKFQTSKSASSSASDVLTATASSGASNGSYSIEVSKLAQAQKLATAGQASKSDVIGVGTLTFDFGSISGGTLDSATGKYTGASFSSNGNGSKTVTIDASNNTLEGIRDAINKAGIGVSASIVNDGSSTPYRLALSVNSAGSSNSLKISVGGGDAALTSLLAHDPSATQNLQETVTAQNTEMKLDGIAISKPSTVIADAIEGVTLNVLKTNVGSPTKISVSSGGSSLGSYVSTFVKAYNDAKKTLDAATAYDGSGAKAGGTTGQAGPLQGDATVRRIQYQMRQMFSSEITGVDPAYNALTKVGISFQKDGTLAVDNTKLQKAMDTSYGNVLALFAATGNATDSLVKYDSSTTATQAGKYDINVGVLASKGTLVGSAVTSGLTVTAGSNDTLAVTLNGVTANITLEAKTYASVDALTAEMQTKINGNSAFSGSSVAIVGTGNAASFSLTATSNLFGATSNFSVSGNAAALFGASPVATAGTDVAGTIGGNSASGSGQKLTAAVGSGASGLAINVTGGIIGDRGSISFSRGFASRLDALLNDFLGSKGTIASRTNGLNASIKAIDNQRDVLNRRLVDTEKRYRDQFTSLDVALGKMTQTQNYMTQQLAALTSTSN